MTWSSIKHFSHFQSKASPNSSPCCSKSISRASPYHLLLLYPFFFSLADCGELYLHSEESLVPVGAGDAAFTADRQSGDGWVAGVRVSQ